MGRRLILIIGIALAAASGVRPVPAQQAEIPAASQAVDPLPAPPSVGEPLDATPALPSPVEDTAALSPGSPIETIRDDTTIPLQDPGVEPTAAPAPGGRSPARTPGGEQNPFMLPPEELGLGRQVVGLSVEVQAPEKINLHQETKLKINVRNTGTSRAMGVVVRDPLPDGLEYKSSQPEAHVSATGSGTLLTWNLGTLAPNTDRVLIVTVRPIKAVSFDHAPTVEILAGGKSRTLVQEPKLRVEQTVKRDKVLKGSQVAFDIVVSNPGTGPVRNVLVRARLSSGLRHGEGVYVEQEVRQIEPGARIALESLVVDATAGGEQTCAVDVRSDDVPQATEEAATVQKIEVVEPKLTLKLSGPTRRFTDTPATYKLSVENPGTAAARDVLADVTLPIGCVLDRESTGGIYESQYNKTSRKLVWVIPQLDAGGRVELPFTVRLGGIQLFNLAAQVRSQGPIVLSDRSTFHTDVTGMADVTFDVVERRRVIDVGAEAVYEIVVKNQGTMEASRLQVHARLSEHFKYDDIVTSGTDRDASGDGKGEVVFPEIDRLAIKGELPLTIRARAVKAGVATCTVYLLHDGLDKTPISKTITTHVFASDSASR